MDAAVVRELVRLGIAAGGALSIFLGYKLFCDARGTSVINAVAGAALAVFGMAILTADVRSLAAQTDARPVMQHSRPAEAGSFTTPGSNGNRTTGAWLT